MGDRIDRCGSGLGQRRLKHAGEFSRFISCGGRGDEGWRSHGAGCLKHSGEFAGFRTCGWWSGERGWWWRERVWRLEDTSKLTRRGRSRDWSGRRGWLGRRRQGWLLRLRRRSESWHLHGWQVGRHVREVIQAEGPRHLHWVGGLDLRKAGQPIAKARPGRKWPGNDVGFRALPYDFENGLFSKTWHRICFLGAFQDAGPRGPDDMDPNLLAGEFLNRFVAKRVGCVGNGGNQLVGGLEGHENKPLKSCLYDSLRTQRR